LNTTTVTTIQRGTRSGAGSDNTTPHERQMSEAGRHIVTIDQGAAGERLDRALAAALPGLTRSRVKALIESRRVALANGSTVEEPSRKVKIRDSFNVHVP